MFQKIKSWNYKVWIKRFGMIWLLFFIIKGIAWVAITLLIAKQ
jgi:hypothetical protein